MQKHMVVWIGQMEISLYDNTGITGKYTWKLGTQSLCQLGPWKLYLDLSYDVINSFLVYPRFAALGILDRLKRKVKPCQESVHMG